MSEHSSSKFAPRIAVVGAGIAGVSAAWKLRKLLGREARIMVAEAYDRTGGKLKTVDFATGPVDMGAEAFLAARGDFASLVEEVGLAADLRSPNTYMRSGIFAQGKVVDIPSRTMMGIPATGGDVAGVLTAEECERVDREKRGAPLDWTVGQDASVGQLVTDRVGRAVTERLVAPLLGGVYSCHADHLGVRATVPALAEALDEDASRGQGVFLVDAISRLLDQRDKKRSVTDPIKGGAPKAVFQALQGGYRSLVDAMLDQADAEILLNTGVEGVWKRGNGWYIEPIGDVDAVVIATPAPTASVLLDNAAPTAAGILGDVELSSSVVVGMRFASDYGIPDRSGILMGEDAPTDAKAFTFSSRKWPHIAGQGGAFVRASFGSYDHPWYVDMSDRALLTYAVDDLAAITGERKNPEEFFIQRWWGGLPRYSVGFLDRMKEAMSEIDTVRGLALAGSMINGVGVPATAASGLAAAEKLAGEWD